MSPKQAFRRHTFIGDLIRKTDFTRGFANLHVVWPLKDLDGRRPVDSRKFASLINLADGTTKGFRWRLRFRKRHDDIEIILLQNPDSPMVALVRLKMCDGNKSILNEQFFNVYLPDEFESCVVGHVQSESGPEDLTCHCWISIPIGFPYSTISTREQQSASNLSWDSASDVTLKVIDPETKERRRFCCHQRILAAKSPVFCRMFASDQWEEANGVVEIKDIDKDVLRYVIRYIYTGQIWDEKWANNAEDVDSNDFILDAIYAADKYDLRRLIDNLQLLLITSFENDSNRIAQLESADQHCLPQLKSVCLTALASDLGSIDPTEWELNLFSELKKEAKQIQSRTPTIEVKSI